MAVHLSSTAVLEEGLFPDLPWATHGADVLVFKQDLQNQGSPGKCRGSLLEASAFQLGSQAYADCEME